MKTLILYFGILSIFFVTNAPSSLAQEVKASNAEKWSVSGRIQLQHAFSSDIESDAEQTNNGFRIRRGRLQVKGTLNEYVSTKFQIEVRDNDPRLKDAVGKLKLFDQFFLRVGQFKVPVWREELRSSGSLLLVERSAAAEFLADLLLSARHVGIEFGGQFQNGVDFAVNYSNGAGEGEREDAGRNKSFSINNGKLFTGRINVAAADIVQIGFSAAANQLGNDIPGMDNSGTIYAIAPDFGVYLESGLDIEGGIAFGSISKDLLEAEDNQNFFITDITGRWHFKLSPTDTALAGLDGMELAAGISYVDPDYDINNNETIYLRFGPAFNFGEHTRIQINGEIEDPAAEGLESTFLLRSQATFNF